jgi:hypothetical protein
MEDKDFAETLEALFGVGAGDDYRRYRSVSYCWTASFAAVASEASVV